MNLVQGLTKYNAAKAELEAAVVEELRGASTQVLVRVAEVLANGSAKAVAAVVGATKSGPKATLKVAAEGVTVSKPSERLSNGLGPKVVGAALALLPEGGSVADVVGRMKVPGSLGKRDVVAWVRGHLQAGVKRGDFVRLGQGVYRVVQKAVKPVVRKAVEAPSGGTGLTLPDVWKVMRKSKMSWLAGDQVSPPSLDW